MARRASGSARPIRCAQWPCEGCAAARASRSAHSPHLAPRGPVAESSGGAEIEWRFWVQGAGGISFGRRPENRCQVRHDRRRRRRVVGGEWRVEEIFWRWRRWRGDFWEIFATGSEEGFLFLLPRGSVAVTICVWYCYNLARDTRAERALVRVSLRLLVGPRVGHGVGGWASTPCALRRVGVTRR